MFPPFQTIITVVHYSFAMVAFVHKASSIWLSSLGTKNAREWCSCSDRQRELQNTCPRVLTTCSCKKIGFPHWLQMCILLLSFIGLLRDWQGAESVREWPTLQVVVIFLLVTLLSTCKYLCVTQLPHSLLFTNLEELNYSLYSQLITGFNTNKPRKVQMCYFNIFTLPNNQLKS